VAWNVEAWTCRSLNSCWWGAFGADLAQTHRPGCRQNLKIIRSNPHGSKRPVRFAAVSPSNAANPFNTPHPRESLGQARWLLRTRVVMLSTTLSMASPGALDVSTQVEPPA
jgi:hypothetical protein